MNLTGRYSIIKRDKNKKIIDKITKYNTITKTGQSVMMELFKKSSHVDDFHNMVGYKILDLTPYYIKPVFQNNNTEINQLQYKTIMDPNFDSTSAISGYYTNFVFEDNQHPNLWKVSSSFFDDGQDVRLYGNFYNDSYDYNDERSCRYVTPYSCDWHLKNNRTNIVNGVDLINESVDKILLQNNTTSMIWNNYNESVAYFRMLRNCHNIDFFRVKCIQNVTLYKTNITIPLWNGSHYKQNNLFVFNQPNVILKCNYNKTYNKNLVIKYRTKDSGNQYQTLTSGYTIDTNNMTINITYENFPASINANNIYELVVEYYVYYKDQQLKNGICGMYLNYNLTYDSQGYGSMLYGGRMGFGNGIFSYNGGESFDNYVAYPWQGRPIYRLTYNRQTDSRYDFNTWLRQSYYNWDYGYNHHICFVTNEFKDDNWERYYSFYPFVSNRPTNFMFGAYFADCQLSMKNFIFLIPDFTVSTPRVFSFGISDKQVSENDEKLDNEQLRMDALQCYTDQEDDSIIVWKTYMDYTVGNGITIKQLGLQCGDVVLQQSSYANWNFIRPLKKQDCNKLFSRVVLDEPITKTEQQSLEVLYEIVAQ